MMRRRFIEIVSTLYAVMASTAHARVAPERQWVAPGTPDWPSELEWAGLEREVDGKLTPLKSPFADCSTRAQANEVFRELSNPYFINEHANVTQTLGWAGAWQSEPGAYALAAASPKDIARGVAFADRHNVRITVRGGAHSYQGTSNAANSLVLWTRNLNAIEVHDAFVPTGSMADGVPAVSVGAGNLWGHVYDVVTTQHGRYVQGGGCATVGVAGLVSGGGFGSFSKRYGLAAASLLEAEVVTADGEIRIANAHTNPDLFWALKGGGGGTFGVITRLTLRTHELPEQFGFVFGSVRAKSDSAFKRLIARFVEFYAASLHNPHWGEQAAFSPHNTLELTMLFQGFSQDEAGALWRPFFEWIDADSDHYEWAKPPMIITLPARHFWDVTYIKKHFPWAMVVDPRPGANPRNFWWSFDSNQVAQYIDEYVSLWLPDSLLSSQNKLAEALFASSRSSWVSLHFNKGLSGASPDTIEAARNTAMNPKVLNAFALVIIASSDTEIYPGIPGHEPNPKDARDSAQSVRASIAPLQAIAPDGGSYVSESSFFEENWPEQYWGPNYGELQRVKRKYDPRGLFEVHHGVVP